MKLIRFNKMIVFAMLLFVVMIPQVASAEVDGSFSDFSTVPFQEGDVLQISPTEQILITGVHVTPLVYDQNGQMRAWYYTIETKERVTYEPDQTVEQQIYRYQRLDIRDVNGNYYIAEGYLDLISVAYDFPEDGWKTATYEGTIGCYIY